MARIIQYVAVFSVDKPFKRIGIRLGSEKYGGMLISILQNTLSKSQHSQPERFLLSMYTPYANSGYKNLASAADRRL